MEAGCEIRGDEAVCDVVAGCNAASEEDWSTEYLDAIISVRVVDDIGSTKLGGKSRPAWLDDGPATVAGHQLVERGIQPPILHPESVLIVDGDETRWLDPGLFGEVDG